MIIIILLPLVSSSNHHYIISISLLEDVPNAGEGLKRLQYRQQWDVDLRAYLKKLDQSKPVICCGDMNVAHHPIGIYEVWLGVWLYDMCDHEVWLCNMCDHGGVTSSVVCPNKTNIYSDTNH